MNTKNDYNDYYFRPMTNGWSCSRHSRTSLKLSSPLAEGWAFHPGGDSTGAVMERRHLSTDPRRRAKGHTQSHQCSLVVSAVASAGQKLPHTAFVLTSQLNRDRFQGYGSHQCRSVVP